MSLFKGLTAEPGGVRAVTGAGLLFDIKNVPSKVMLILKPKPPLS